MPYARKLILHAPPWDSPLLEGFVDACLKDSVALICVIGDDCERVHDVIDELVVYILVVRDDNEERLGKGLTPMTSWHMGATLEEVRAFAEMYRVDGDEHAQVQEVTLTCSSSGA